MKKKNISTENGDMEIDTNKYKIFLSEKDFVLEELKRKCNMIFDLGEYQKEIDLFMDDFSEFWLIFLFIIYGEKRIFKFDIYKEKELIEILDSNRTLYEKMKLLKSIKRIYLLIAEKFRKNESRISCCKILLYNVKSEYYIGLMNYYYSFIFVYDANIFIYMSEEQWDELVFENKSHFYSVIKKYNSLW